MTVTSGRKCSELLTNSGHLGCWVKTLLASSVWRSTTFYLTWKASATKRKRLLFRLVPSVPRTGETGCSSWPTPDVPNGGRGIPKDAVRRGSTIYASDGRKVQIGLQNAVRMWPTPAAADGERQSHTYMRGNPTLLGAAMWPTPRASDGEKGGPNQRDSKGVYALPGAVAHAWPTPNSRDHKGAPGAGSIRRGGHQSSLPAKIQGQLNPAWVECLMGFPPSWTECDGPPFRGLSMTGNLSERQ